MTMGGSVCRGKFEDEAWNQRYKELIDYKTKHGNCIVPRNYKPNKQLGAWVMHQRYQYRKLHQGKKSSMTEERIDKLEEIGLEWNVSHLAGAMKVDDEAWNRKYGELIEYKEKHGNCIVPRNYKSNKPLGEWVVNQRRQYRLLQEGKHSRMTEERVTKLEKVGFKWKIRG